MVVPFSSSQSLGSVPPASSKWRESLPSRGYKSSSASLLTTSADTAQQQQQQILKIRSLDSANQLTSSSSSCMTLSDRGDGENDIIVQTADNNGNSQLQFLLAKPRDYSVLGKFSIPNNRPIFHLDWIGNVLLMASDDGNVYLNRVDRSIMNGKSASSGVGKDTTLNCITYNLPTLRASNPITPSPEQYTPTSRISRVHIQPVSYSSLGQQQQGLTNYDSDDSHNSGAGGQSDSDDSDNNESNSESESNNSESDDNSSDSSSSSSSNRRTARRRRRERRRAAAASSKKKKSKKSSVSKKSKKSSNRLLPPSIDGPTKFLSLENHRLHIWQLERNDAPISSVKGSNAPLTCAAWNENNVNQVVIGGVNRSLKVLDIRALNTSTQSNTGHGLVSWKCDQAHSDAIRDVQWNPMIPNWLATCGNDNIINVWDLRYNNGLPLITLEGHDNIVKRISWSRFHCDMLLSGGIDHCVKLWNLRVEPHYILATVGNTFNDSICSVECSRTKAMFFYGQSSSGELATIEATPMFMSPLVFSRFSEEETEERNAESIIYYRLLKNAFSKILTMAKKFKTENNLDKALRLLELCKERPLPSSTKNYFNEYVSSSDALNRFRKELREYSYFLPPNVKGLSEIPPETAKEIDNLILNCQILRFVQRNEFNQVFALEDKLLQLLEQDVNCIEISTIQDVINLYLSHDYRKGMSLVISIGRIFAKKRAWSLFDPISKKILSPTTFEVSNNPTLQENAYRILQKTLSNTDFILSQMELQKDVICALWGNNTNSAKYIIDMVEHYSEHSLHTDIISVPVLRTYLNALLCASQLDKFFIESTDVLQNLQGHDFAVIVKELMRDVAAFKLRNLLMRQFGVGGGIVNNSNNNNNQMQQNAAKSPVTSRRSTATSTPTKDNRKSVATKPTKPTPKRSLRRSRRRRGSTSSDSSSSDSDNTSASETGTALTEDTHSESETDSESTSSSMGTSNNNRNMRGNDDQEFFARTLLKEGSGRISESVALTFFVECKPGVVIVLNISKFCSVIPNYLQQMLKDALDVIEKCVQKICKIFDDSNEEAVKFARDVLRRVNMRNTSEAEDQEAQNIYMAKAIRIENLLMDFLKLDDGGEKQTKMMRTSALKRLVVPARQQPAATQAGGRITNLGPTVSAPRRIVQDMPPPGGFKPARIRRNMPNKFWSVGTTCAVIVAIMGVGWYRYYKWYEKKCHLKKEEERLQLAMIPFLQAEHDITYTIKRRAFMKKVTELMQDEKDFDVDAKFYHNKNYFAYPRVNTELDVFEGTGLLEADVKPVA